MARLGFLRDATMAPVEMTLLEYHHDTGKIVATTSIENKMRRRLTWFGFNFVIVTWR